jgi:hypothetical protein
VTSLGGALALAGHWLGQQPRHAHEVVRGGYQVARQLGASQAAITRPTKAADRFQPAKYFLNSLPQVLPNTEKRFFRNPGDQDSAPVSDAGGVSG